MTDLDGRAFTSDGRCLLPADIMASEFLAGLGKGQHLVRISKPRSIDQLRYFFAILRAVVDATDIWVDEDAALDALKERVGHMMPVRRWDGTVFLMPKSISFASMAGDRFRVFFDKSMAAFEQDLGIEPMALLAEADKIAPRPKALTAK